MRDLKEKNKYNYVLNLFTSFGYFDNKKDNQIVIQSISKSLKKNGVFIIDFINMKFWLKNILKKETKTVKNIDFNITKYRNQKFLYKNIQFKFNTNYIDLMILVYNIFCRLE